MTKQRKVHYADEDVCPECKGEGMTLQRPMLGQPYYLECEFCEGTGQRIVCATCGEYLELVRPGKHQCPNCG